MTDHLADVRKEPHPGAVDDLLHGLDQGAADQAVRADLRRTIRPKPSQTSPAIRRRM